MPARKNPFWLKLPAGLAHELAPFGLKLYADFYAQKSQSSYTWKSLEWKDLQFRNRLGIAGGVDKNADLLHVWPSLGCGFAEIGTVTPRPQKPNPGKIISRDFERRNLWNKMGFPSDGARVVASVLAHTKTTIPTFINIGKNRDTDNSRASHDYVECVEVLSPYADAFVVNVSSPNTKGLRELQGSSVLNQLCRSVVAQAAGIPVLLKLSPDLNDVELQAAIDIGQQSGISGFILSNTTLWRPEGSPFPAEGGLSGHDLAGRSKLMLMKTQKMLGEARKDTLVISAGGVMSPEDVEERLALGADLVQVYSALVFWGPSFFRQVSELMSPNSTHKKDHSDSKKVEA